MSVRDAYDEWSLQYDTNENRTRDLEARALRECLSDKTFSSCLEIGCGTGKNTEWLVTRVNKLLGVDLSPGMLEKAKMRSLPPYAGFVLADIREDWNFTQEKFDLVTFSLVLEHIRDLEAIFSKTAGKLSPGGYVYAGELHPYKQYAGSRARYETPQGKKEVEGYPHHISDFVEAAEKAGLKLELIREYFDEDDRTLPRVLVLVFKKC